jgi:hypothetical protein
MSEKIKVKTSTGFQCEVDARAIKDVRFLRAIKRLSEGKSDLDAMNAVLDLWELVLGPEGVDRLGEHCADEDGYQDTDKMTAEVTEILEQLKAKDNDIKN